ncbi:MAG: WD40 repeat domain-containing protein, partial [Planctomycetales bacterium]|nr:WD40 repeat domain-containing protein [Planctomycetales bacterium]
REVASGEAVRVLTGHEAAIDCVAFSPDSKTLVSGSRDGVIKLWPIDGDGDPASLTAGVSNMRLAVSADGRFLAAGGEDGKVRLWNWSQWETPIELPPSDAGELSTIAFSMDGDALACAWDNANPTYRIHLFNTADGTPKQILTGHTSTVHSLVFSADGRQLASAGRRDVSRLWDLDSGESTEFGEPGRLQFSPDGNTIVILTRFGFFTHDVPTRKTTREHLYGFWGYGFPAFRADGRTLAIGDGAGAVRYYDTQTWKPEAVALERDHSATVSALAVHPDGRTVFSMSFDCTVRRWDVASPRSELFHHLSHQAAWLTCSPDGEDLAICTQFQVWQTSDARQRFAKPIELVSLAYSPDGKTIAGVGRWDSTLHLWDSKSGTEIHRFGQLDHWGFVVAFSDDGQFLAAGGNTGEVHVWKVSDGKEIAAWTTTTVNNLTIQPKSNLVVTGHHDGAIRFWDLSTQRMVREFQTHERVLGLRFTPDGSLLLSTAYDSGMLQIRAAEQEKPLAVIPVIPEKVLSGSRPVVFDVDRSGQFIFASGPTTSIYVHRISRDLWTRARETGP